MHLAVVVMVLVALQARVTWAHPLLQFSLQNTKNVICPHDQGECPEGNTCCQLASGQLDGCCPLPSAVCCSDGQHCCPNGYTCDISVGTCTKQAEQIAMVERRPSIMRVEDVRCDLTQSCPNGDTCCLLPDGYYGCCPQIHGVCCPHSEYCCPYRYRCCRDGQHCCPYQYSCCPDSKHCCPSGYSCDPSSDRCVRYEADQNLIVKKLPAIMSSESHVIYPDPSFLKKRKTL